MSRPLRIVLLGGRSFPALLNILRDSVGLVKVIAFSTPQRPHILEQFKDALPPYLRNKYESDIIDPDNFEAAYNKLFETISELEEEVSIDITPAPKIPALAAWEIARKFRAEIIYTSVVSMIRFRFDFSDSTYPRVYSEKLLDESMDVRTYLSLYGRKMRRNWSVMELELNSDDVSRKENLAFEVGRHFVINYDVYQYLLPFLRCLLNKSDRIDDFIFVSRNAIYGCDKYWKRNKDRWKMFEREFEYMESIGLIRDLKKGLFNAEFLLPSSNEQFLLGKWLDFYIYTLSRYTDLFQDCEYSVEIPSSENTRNELDFIGISYKGWVYIAEAKTGEVTRKELDALNTVADLIGGRAIVKYMILFRNSNQISESFVSQARERWINVLSVRDIASLDLFRERLSKPEFGPI